MRTIADIDNVFTFHPPVGDQAELYDTIRTLGKHFARAIFQACPESPERTLALRDVQRAVMMANASIALNPPKKE